MAWKCKVLVRPVDQALQGVAAHRKRDSRGSPGAGHILPMAIMADHISTAIGDSDGTVITIAAGGK